MTDQKNLLSANKQALLKIRELKQQLAEAENSGTYEPIAIVSMACRFPRRANTPEAFWQSLIDQSDEVSEVPDDRWDLKAFHDEDPEVPGKMYARHGVFLDNIDQMDPEFFGISPREATWVDPQQRLLMEVGWEALERAGWVPEKIGEHTGVFIGWMHNDYQNEASDSFLNLNPYIATGAAGSFLCGRLAYYLGLQGPSLAVDTACSSSLVALHLACQSLQKGDCDRALVGGVNAICSPTTNILTCKLKALSPSGHSRAFDAAADGYLRGEGCGVITIRRLADAEKDGDPILGVIRGSAVGHNGFSSGLTAPNPKAQEKVIRQAVERAQLLPTDIAYLEAHGTGTELGDPLEMQAAAAALATGRSKENPLLVGSVKTNIGHLEAAAGMAGLIKVLLSMQKNQIPGQLNFETPNPHIAWDKTAVKVLTKATDWPTSQRTAGVSAFGMSGTNAHVVITESPGGLGLGKADGDGAVDEPSAVEEQAGKSHLVVVSGKSEAAVQELAAGLETWLHKNADASLADVAFTTTCRRSHFEHRAAVVATNREEAIQSFNLLSRNGQSDSAFANQGRRAPKTVWQFTGQGSQYLGMGRQLYQTETVFRDAIDYCNEQLATVASRQSHSLRDVLFKSDGVIDHTSWTQPCIFSVQMGLSKLLQSRGLNPDVVMGHSVGQYAAACVAGIMSWEDGLKLISERGRLIGDLPSGGLMLAVFASASDVEKEVADFNASSDTAIDLAANNGTHVVVSGVESAVVEFEERFTERKVRCRRLTTSHAFHSSLMDPALEPFQKFAESVSFAAPQLPLVCNMSGQLLEAGTVLDGKYWANHIRAAVRYSESVQAVQELGCEVVLELGPQGVLTRMAAANWTGGAGRLISCLDKGTDDSLSVLQAVGKLYSFGANVDFESMFHAQKIQSIILPTYPFQRRRFWGPDKPRAAHSEFHTAHPLLGGKVALAGMNNETRFESFIEPDSPPWLPDHEVMGQVVLPGAAYVEIALAASASNQVSSLAFEKPLRPISRTSLQTVLRTTDDGSQSIETWSCGEESDEWVRHFTASISAEVTAGNSASLNLADLKNACPEVASPAEFYSKMREVGLNYGPDFQTIQSLQFSESEVLAHLQTNGDIRGFAIPPTLLDGALHSMAVGLLKEDDGNLFLPVGIDRVQCFQTIEQEVWCHAKWTNNEGKQRTADLTLFQASGEVAVVIKGLKVQQISRAALRQMSGSGAERLIYDLDWKNFRLPTTAVSNKRWYIISESDDGLAKEIAGQLSGSGNSVSQFSIGESADVVLAGVSPENPPHGITWVLSDDSQSNCDGILRLIQALQQKNVYSLECGLELITRSGISIAADETCNPHQTKYWGLGRVLGAEQPGLRCRLIDVEVAGGDLSAVGAIVAEILATETRDSQLVVRNSQILVPRMKRTTVAKNSQQAMSVKADSSFLITGGLGMLGRQAAKWLAEKGADQVVLVSRRSPDDVTKAFLDEVRDSGCDVVVHSADMSVREDAAAMFERFGNDLKPLAGVIHAAGIVDDALIGEQTWERFGKVMAPKVQAASLLDEFTRQLDLDFFVLYSSAASVLGSPGQSNYATGNGYLDGLAWQRRSQGLPATSINWGPWTEGMADDERIVKRLALQGIAPLTIADAHSAMEQMLNAAVVQAMVLDVDWGRMRMGLGGESPAMLEGLAPAKQKSQMGDSQLVASLKKLKGNAQKELLVKTVQESLQRILSTSEAPEIDRPLIEMGLDSLMAVEFGTELQQMLGDQFSVGPTMLFDHPTIDAIADHVLELIVSEAGSDSSTATEKATQADSAPQLREREPIAIVGMSCRFPGARSVDEFWHNILNGVDSVREIPSDRWNIDRFYSADREPGKMYTREGGFLDDIADFDAAFFNISEQEACWIDPQHRMLLENSYRALEDAGISSQPLADSNVGVFMGIMGQDYAFLPTLDDEEVVAAFQGAGLSHSAGVGRISYVFGFEGPSIAIDTASSSSLVALHQAVRSLQDGNCNMALAGGVNAILAPVNSLLMSKAGLLSPDGRCKSFSADADGFGRGEGCGVVVLKRLSDAQRDGDRILALVRGGAVVHNGSGGGITTPSGKSQARVITEALKDAQVAPSQVQYLEAHGTGTEFGDPMELSAAASVYGKGRKRDNPLLVGSVKANISHLEAAGGISGLIKTVLALHHKVIPPQAHFDKPSPHIPWKRMPVKMVTETTSWPEAEERWAGVTALGLVGTNAHVVLSSAPVVDAEANESSVDDAGVQEECPSQLLLLSARNSSSLIDVAHNYERLLTETDHEVSSLVDVCHTAAVGRRHFENRLAIVSSTAADCAKKLAAFAEGQLDEGVMATEMVGKSTKVAWAFTGQVGSNLDGVAREFFHAVPVFRQLVGEFQQRLTDHCSSADGDEIDLIAWLSDQPAKDGGVLPSPSVRLYVLQAGLAAVWRDWGVEPDAVTGFGVGQFAASCVAGGLCFKDALTLVVERDIALEANSDDAFQAYEKFADTLNFYPPNVPLICSSSGTVVPVHRSLAGSYWREQLTAETAKAKSRQALLEQKCGIILEVGPEKMLDMTVDSTASEETFIHLASLNPNQSGLYTTQQVLGRLYSAGLNLNFARLNASRGRRIRLPLYPFQKKRYWITEVGQYVEERVSS